MIPAFNEIIAGVVSIARGIDVKMKLLIYSTQNQGVENILARSVHEEFPQIQIDEANSLQRLSEIICRPLHGIAVIIVNICERRELIELLSYKHLLEDIRVILILPRNTKNMMTLGLKLQPSFTCYSDSGFDDIMLVLDKIQRI